MMETSYLKQPNLLPQVKLATKQNGFTLVESLVVLSIFMILSSITVFSLKPEHSMIDDEAFLTQLKGDLYYAQAYAISHQNDVAVSFFPEDYTYSLMGRSGQVNLLDRTYSTDIDIVEGTIPLYFRYLSDGMVNKSGTILIRSKNKTYMLTMLIGKGRFYVTEQ